MYFIFICVKLLAFFIHVREQNCYMSWEFKCEKYSTKSKPYNSFL